MSSSVINSSLPVNHSSSGSITQLSDTLTHCTYSPAGLASLFIERSINLVVGYPANIMVMWLVAGEKSDSSTSNHFIFSLATADAWFCIPPPSEESNRTLSLLLPVCSFFVLYCPVTPTFYFFLYPPSASEALQVKMELISWSLNAIDRIFSPRSGAPGEPRCPDSSFAAGYVRDAWSRWKVLCLAALSLEDVEDVYLFGFMVTGFLLIGMGVALIYPKVCELGSRKMPNALPSTEIIMERLSGVTSEWAINLHRGASENGELFKKILGSSAEMHRKMDAVLSECGEFVRLTVNLGKRQDEMMGELVALKHQEQNLQNG